VNVLANLAVLAATTTEEHQAFEAHNPLLPETLEIIWGGTAFLVVAFLLWKFAVPAIKSGMAARSERIQRELDNAAKAHADADAEATEIRTKLGDIDAERARMLADADQTAERLLVEGRNRLEAEEAELRAKADADIAGAGSRVASELEGQVGQMAAAATEQLVTNQLDDATVQRLVEDFIARVGSDGKVNP
jgi:F-type H+-transporting ATPase subunit b